MQDFGAWRDEVLALSDIVQDGDTSVPPDEAQRRFDRFIALVNGVRPDAPDEVFLTLLETFKDQDDYGAYETVLQAFVRVPPARRGRLVAEGVIPLLRRAPDVAGNVLGQIAFDAEAAAAFSRAVRERAAPEERRELSAFVAEEEQDGWLRNEAQRGRLRFG